MNHPFSCRLHKQVERCHNPKEFGRVPAPHDKAVIRTTSGQEESHLVRPVARSKVASVPVGVAAVFLIDELDKIVDVTFGSMEAVHRAAELWQKKDSAEGKLEPN